MNPLPSAVFLDRDGTIIEDAHYLSKAEQVTVIEGAAEAIARINALTIPVVVVTNQSGIGRGLFTVEDYLRVAEHLDSVLAREGARLDATFFCPHSPDDKCKCRKPGVLLFQDAARSLSLNLSRAVYIGDRLRDIEPAFALGGHGVLVPSHATPAEDVREATLTGRVAPSLGTALDWFLCSN